MPPSPQRKQAPKTEVIRVKVTPEQVEELRAVASLLRCSVPEVMRRGIPAIKQSALAIQAGVGAALVLSGDDMTVQAKQKAIAQFGKLRGPALAAEAAGVTMRTISYWVKSDSVFAQLAEEAAARQVEMVEGKLVELALGDPKPQAGKPVKPNLSAIFGVLNAKHPDYGQIRPHMMARYLKALFRIVVNRVATFVRPGDLERLAEELRRDFDEFAESAGGGGK